MSNLPSAAKPGSLSVALFRWSIKGGRMIELPQVPPPAYEQTLTQKLLKCGLKKGRFTVKYEDELQSFEIVIEREAGASAQHFDCIRQAVNYEIVTFSDPELQHGYDDRLLETVRPKMLADARAELQKRGILDGFPERSKFGSDKLFAEALERQCGLPPGSFFVQSEWGLIVRPKLGGQSQAYEDRVSCLMAAIMYVSAKGESFKVGFIGNEAVPPGS